MKAGSPHIASGMKTVEMRSKKLYPILDLSSIIPPGSKDRATEEDAVPAEGRTPTMPEVIQVPEATPKQRGEGDD